MRKAFGLIIVLLIFGGVKYLFPELGQQIYSQTPLLTGVVLLASYLFALLLKKAKLPKLTGYMVLGVLLGPIGLDFLNVDALSRLKFLENLALSFIALTAGGELKYARIKKDLKAIFMLLGGQLIIVFVGLFLILILFANYIPFVSTLSFSMLMGFSILFAGISLSKSPATTMGIITEFHAKGRNTDLVLSITVLKSIILVAIFPLILTWSKFYLLEGIRFNGALLADLLVQLGGSILMGVAIGYMIIGYLKFINAEKSLFLLGVTIVITEMTSMLNIEILLTSIVAGVVVENFSDKGEQLILSIEESSLPLYIIFFSFAGAGLHLDTLQKALGLTIFLVLARMILLYVGNFAGALIAKEPKEVKHFLWLGFIGQAGIAVGLGTVIERAFPGEIGATIKTILIATVVINELLGPIFFKYVLIKTGEAKTQ